MKYKIFFLLLLGIFGLLACTGNESSFKENKNDDIKNKPIEYQMACLNANDIIKEDDITVARFRTLLELISSKFIEDRKQIFNITFHAQTILKEKGVSESLLNIMEGINKIFYSDFKNQKYAEYVAAYVTLRVQGQSHDEAIVGLRAMFLSMGVY